MRIKHSRMGFTLVELLVVIAIIGVLVALLLPAVQAAREAARRSSCQNNVKQLGIAIHNFHDTMNRLPAGTATDVQPFATGGGGWGSSWLVFILPYIEQGPLYDKFLFNGNSGYTNANNLVYFNNAKIKGYTCPSHTVDPEMATARGANVQISHYAGIAGAYENSAVLAWVDSTKVDGSHGRSSNAGTFFHNSKNTLASLTDGTSNVMMIGEQSRPLTDVNNVKKPLWLAGGIYGWTMGYGYATVNATDNRHFNCTTVRYAINTWKNVPGSDTYGGAGAAGGIGSDAGVNSPLVSNHPAGINVGIADGSCRFLPSNTALDVLYRIAVRDDGLTVDLP